MAERPGPVPGLALASQLYLPCTDLADALAFYRGTLGLDTVVDGSAGACAAASQAPAARDGISLVLEPSHAGRVRWESHIAMTTPNLDAAFAHLEAHGAEVIQEPIRHASGARDCAFLDPGGNIVRIQEAQAAAAPRDQPARKADVLRVLSRVPVDGWVATTTASARAHLVPLSLAWIDQRIVIAVPESSATARNLRGHATARIGAGATRDVIMIDAVLEDQASADPDSRLRHAYRAQAGWDPGQEDGYGFRVLRPTRIQAWRERNELRDRDLMIGGRWLV